MQSEDPLSDRLRAESIIADFLDGAADPAVVASFTTAEPVDALAMWIAEMAEVLMGQFLHKNKNEAARECGNETRPRSDLDTAVSLLAPGSGRKLLSGMRTGWVMRPCAFKVAIRFGYATGNVGVKNAFIAVQQRKGGALGGGI